MPAINELSVSIYLSMPRTKTNLVRGDFGYPVNTDRFWLNMQTKYKLNLSTPSYSSNCSIPRAKKLETKSITTKQKNLKNGKVRFRLNIDVRKRRKTWLNTIKTIIAFVKDREYNISQSSPFMDSNLF